MPAWMEALLSTQAIAWLLVIFLMFEGALLYWIWKRFARGIPPLAIVTFLGSGLAFALALGIVLANANPIWLALALVAAFTLHICDIAVRWKRRFAIYNEDGST